MQTIITTTTTSRSFYTDGPRVVERTRGSAHPKVPTTRQAGGASALQRSMAGSRP
jgi:hypothetical protein